ncbi:RNA-guided endonuclease TnpB family protein [Brevibacillus sp. DP1.3A]|uniref:RNA-guided endonuclease InsQ/TnpB family protein n=1 Tax=Brevibacillus sp. DP1.3A TaxID=2738867 RepID=UPI00156BC914|nr:RNA-guided endonuclease TnpB family protein [Brevibacillus sp. DP1.3A]UED75429.1 transposase [Brevibacillus sp. DP1.3A]
MLRTYKFRIEPTKEQLEKISETLMYCRWLYNALLEQRIIAYKKFGVSLTFYSQKKELPSLKKVCKEYNSVHSQVLQNVVERLDKAYQAFFRRLKHGEKAGFPRFKGMNRYHSFTYPQTGFSLEGNHIYLSKIGLVRVKLHRQVQGTIKTCTVIAKNGRYYVCLSCEVETQIQTTGRWVGVDLGLQHLAITSDGYFYDAPKYLRRSERQLKKLHRILSRRKKGSTRRQKIVALLAKQYEYVANQRNNNAHQVSSKLVNGYDLIAFECLEITNMIKNHHFSKSIADAGWNQLVQFTTYKAERAGKRVMLVDPRNTSQLCSSCDEIVKKTLAVRTHHCPFCGLECDRDVNAAKNILKRALQQLHNLS